MPGHFKTAVVTGAASGMGRVLATRLATRGTSVHALDRDADGLEVLAKEARGVRPHAVDVTDADALMGMLAPLADEIDLLVTAAGVGHTAPLLDIDSATFARVMAINYLGTVNTIAPVLPAMVRRRSGRIVLFASLAGWVPARSCAAYNPSKAALVMYAEILRQELAGTGVGVTCVCPPAVATPLLDDMPAAKAALRRGMRAMPPEKVIDAIETAIERDRFWVFPDTTAKILWRVRRHTPRLLDAMINRMLPTSLAG